MSSCKDLWTSATIYNAEGKEPATREECELAGGSWSGGLEVPVVLNEASENKGDMTMSGAEDGTEITLDSIVEAEKEAAINGLITEQQEQQAVADSQSVLPKGGIDDLIKTISDDDNDLDEMSLKTRGGAKITLQNQRGKTESKSNVIEPIFPTIAGTTTKGQVQASEGTPQAVTDFLSGASSQVEEQPTIEQLGLPEVDPTAAVSPDGVSDDQFISTMDQQLGAIGSGIGDFAGDAYNMLDGAVDETGQAISGAVDDGSQWIEGAVGDGSQWLDTNVGDATDWLGGAAQELGQSLETGVDDLTQNMKDTLSDVGATIGGAVEESKQWLKEVLSEEVDPEREEAIVSNEETAISNLEQVMESSGAIDSEVVVEGVNSFIEAVDSLVGQVESGALPFLKSVSEFDITELHSEELADLGGSIEEGLSGAGQAIGSSVVGAVDDASRAVEGAIDGAGELIAEAGEWVENEGGDLLDKAGNFIAGAGEWILDVGGNALLAIVGAPVMAYNALTEDSPEVVKEEPKTELETEEGKKEPEDTASWIADLLATFTEYTGITSKDLIRALVMYAGSRLVGYSGHDSVQFAFKDWETQVKNRLDDTSDSREFLANTENLFQTVEKLEGMKVAAFESGDVASVTGIQARIDKVKEEIDDASMSSGTGKGDSSAIKNFEYFTAQKKKYDDQLASNQIDETTHTGLMKDLDGMMKKFALDKDDRISLKGEQHKFNTAEINQKGNVKTYSNVETESGKGVVKILEEGRQKDSTARRAQSRANQILTMLDETPIITGGWFGEAAQGFRTFFAAATGTFELEAATGEMVATDALQFAMDYIQMTKGAVSDKEMAAFIEASPGLGRTRLGIQLLMETVKAYAQNDRDRKAAIATWAGAYKVKHKKHPTMTDLSAHEVEWNKDNKVLPPTAQQIQTALEYKEEQGAQEDTEVGSTIDSATTQEELMSIVQGLGGSGGMSKAQKEAAKAKMNSF